MSRQCLSMCLARDWTTQVGLFNPFPNKPLFLHDCPRCLLKTLWEKEKLLVTLKTLWEKEKLLVTSYFTFSHNVFYPNGELSAIFIKFRTVVCKLFSLEDPKICCLGKG